MLREAENIQMKSTHESERSAESDRVLLDSRTNRVAKDGAGDGGVTKTVKVALGVDDATRQTHDDEEVVGASSP